MSSSRWSYSVWYSFWNGNDAETKEEQIMSLWYSLDKTIDWTYSDLLNITSGDIQRRYNCGIEDAQEAMDYVNMFIKAVNKKFESVK